MCRKTGTFDQSELKAPFFVISSKITDRGRENEENSLFYSLLISLKILKIKCLVIFNLILYLFEVMTEI